MYLHKIRHALNYSFASRIQSGGTFSIHGKRFRTLIQDLGDDIFRWQITSPRWDRNPSQAKLTPPRKAPSRSRLSFDSSGALALHDETGEVFLQSAPGQGFGVSGSSWLMQFLYRQDYAFYGMGEKNNGFEKSHLRTKFWNTDVFGDFDIEQVLHRPTDPMYVSIPYLIIKRGTRFAGILVNNPHAVFMDTDSNYHFTDRPKDYVPRVWIGSDDGVPDIYVLYGPTLAELTRKLQRLCGTTPRPPLWALGYHQSRWGYAGMKDLEWLHREHNRHGIPCDGFWLDIDYMERFKVFTFNPDTFGKVEKDLDGLARRGRRVVAILDPGVKIERGYPVYEEGRKAGHFCLNPEKQEFVGHVWPGETAFPDFSLPATRTWWARHVAAFAKRGIAGSWIDMNDPSVAGAEPFDMLFDRGRASHGTYHNQYGLGMAQATREGFLLARPGERPFVISRSGFISQSRHSAIWTGDNASNYFHLKNSIPMTLNLALSGIPFNGPDVPGFARNATPELALDWYKAAFLFPFIRNHSEKWCEPQEPWRFPARVLQVIRHYVRLRYKLLPYLYNLFIRQEESGEAILRPLIHDFAGTPKLPLEQVGDQFLVGPDIMQAPIVDEGKTSRSVVLPGTGRWFSASEGIWLRGGRRVRAATGPGTTPLYFREGAIVPMQSGERTTHANDLGDVEFHLFLDARSRGSFRTVYTFDDGLTFDYRRKAQTSLEITARTTRSTGLEISVRTLECGHTPCRFRLVTYAGFPGVRVTVDGREAPHQWSALRWTITGRPIPARISSAFTAKA